MLIFNLFLFNLEFSGLPFTVINCPDIFKTGIKLV